MTDLMLQMVVYVPLVGALLTYLIGKKVPILSGWIATTAAALSFVSSYSLFNALPDGGSISIQLLPWIDVAEFTVALDLRFDALAAVMCLVITGIGSLIHLYSIAYMAGDQGIHRFFSYLNLFLAAMLILVLGGNYPTVFIGWEGVGLCSYLLIGFWYNNAAYASAGQKAFVVNRIGDVGFLVAMFLMFSHFGSVDIQTLNGIIAGAATIDGIVPWIALALFVGAVGKSAQIPLFVWLPDAMAGPTPVSALIHAATMVTAGVYLLCRAHIVFDAAPEVMVLVACIGLLTAFIAAVIALTQSDIKKVLAYSTVSQLGFMFMAAASGAYWVALFHVITHAFFKACLFLGAGSVIHGCHHEQDMRKMGGLKKVMPITAATYGVATLAIAGIAPFAGYYSKHAILESISSTPNLFLAPLVSIILYGATITSFLTAFYMTRSFAMTFLGSYRGTAHPHESPALITVPLLVLALLSLIGGLWLEHPFAEYLVPVLGPANTMASEGLITSLMHSWVGILGVALGLLMYTTWSDLPGYCARVFAPITGLSRGKFFFDELYDVLIVRPLKRASSALWSIVDQGLIDLLVVMIAKSVDAFGFLCSRTQTGQLRMYALSMLVSALVLTGLYIAL